MAISVRFEDQVEPIKGSTIKIDQGISDLKKPYHPDFGYQESIDFDVRNSNWETLAKYILYYP